MIGDFASRATAQVLKMLPRKRISRSLGLLAERQVPPPLLQKLIDMYVSAYGVDLSEAIIPEGGFQSFDEFFTRRLRPECRPVDRSPGALVSPSDGMVDACGEVTSECHLVVKSQEYSIADLLGSESEARRFEGGRYAVIYLSPRDYHRVHAPTSGRVTQVRHVPGTLFPVNSIGTKNIPRVFARNERVLVYQESPEHGLVATLLVGAVGVGRISLSFDPSIETNQGGRKKDGTKQYGKHGPSLEKGDELGVFHLGSTVLLLTTPEAQLNWTDSATKTASVVQVGQSLAVPMIHA